MRYVIAAALLAFMIIFAKPGADACPIINDDPVCPPPRGTFIYPKRPGHYWDNAACIADDFNVGCLGSRT